MKVYRLITNRTYEMEMFQRANLKLGLDKAVLNPLKQNLLKDGRVDVQRMNKKGGGDAAEVRRVRLLQGGARGPIGGAEQCVLRGGHRPDPGEEREGDHGGLAGRLLVLEGVVRDGHVGEVDINDPNFWTKVIGLQEPREETMGPRVRKKVEYKATMSDETLQETGFEDESE